MTYLFSAIRRNKENGEGAERKVLVEVCYAGDQFETIARLTAQCSLSPGKWRIYRSVNKRNVATAKLEFVKTLMTQLVTPLSTTDRQPEALWKKILASPSHKSERKFLLDVDTKNKELLLQLHSAIGQIPLLEIVETPNGFHYVTPPFDPKLVLGVEKVEIKKDALIFVKAFEVQ